METVFDEVISVDPVGSFEIVGINTETLATVLGVAVDELC